MADDEWHRPVMVDELLDALALTKTNTVIDATFGFGGHASNVLDVLGPEGKLIGFERDPEVAEKARQRGWDHRVTLVNESYVRIRDWIRERGIAPDAVYFDLGLSSFHLDESDRGFSYEDKGNRFDCRFDPESGQPAAFEVLNAAFPSELDTILEKYGEVRRRGLLREALLEARPVRSVSDVRLAIRDCLPPHKWKGEAARVFQAFRIYVNDELEHLQDGLEGVLNSLEPGGRLAAISYHSLEDRIVKEFLRHEQKECVCPPDLPKCACDKVKRCEVASESPLLPGREEVEANPRSRSAKLRYATRC
jgi:16S rRNA (cytosine1402-N4)-methyltransferase